MDTLDLVKPRLQSLLSEQPAVTRNISDLPGCAEKRLSQRFLWLIPKPVLATFQTLELVNQAFTQKIGTCKSRLRSRAQLHSDVRKENWCSVNQARTVPGKYGSATVDY